MDSPQLHWYPIVRYHTFDLYCLLRHQSFVPMKSHFILRTSFSFVLILLTGTIVFGQRWRQATLINKQGDTLKGEAIVQFNSVRFKSGAKIAPVTYDPLEIRTIFIDRETYISTPKIDEKAGLLSPYFAEKLMTGDIELYYIQNNNNKVVPKVFLIRKKDESVILLENMKVSVYVNGNYVDRYNNAYQGQLKQLFADCPTLPLNPQQNYYSEKPMLELVGEYAKCKNYNFSYRKITKPAKATFALIVGTNISNFTSSGALVDGTLFPSSMQSSSVFGGIQLDLSLDKRNLFSYSPELVYATGHIDNPERSIYVSGFQTAKVKLAVDRYTIRINNTIKRQFALKRGMFISVHLGLSFSFMTPNSTAATTISTTNIVTGVTSTTTSDLEIFGSTEVGFIGGAGWRFKRLGMLVRAEFVPGNISIRDDLATTVSHYYFGLTYNF